MKVNNSIRNTVLLFACVGLFAVYTLRDGSIKARELSSLGSSSELSINPYDEPFSLPDRGSSLFDKIFSKQGPQGRTYDVPYPFQRVVSRLTTASGGVAPLQTLFPMGRSLQRVAAIAGMTDITNTDPFFRFPRLVLGFNEESINGAKTLNLNLKGRIYLGMNEKANIIEVISYNDEAGRFEYQVVRDFAPGKQPAVSYANRQLCLTCHQNQTPIFSQGPWLESNASPAVRDALLRVLKGQLGENYCTPINPSVFCNTGQDYLYQGAPVSVDITVPQGLDQSTKLANNFHAYHKMWQRLCPDMECRKELLKQIFLYKLIGKNQLLLTPELKNLNAVLMARWAKEFPFGMSRPDSSIPNRDPLVNVTDRGRENLALISGKAPAVKSVLEQVMALSNIPGEFEPARPRPPMLGAWTSAFLGAEDGSASTVARLISGYSEFFTMSDVKWISDYLETTPAAAQESLRALCSLTPGTSPRSPSFTLQCNLGGDAKVGFTSFFRGRLSDGTNTFTGLANLLRVQPRTPACDPATRATDQNLALGTACPQYENAPVNLSREGGFLKVMLKAPSGLALRLLDGRRIGTATVSFPSGDSSPLVLDFPVYNDLAPLNTALEKAYRSLETKTKDKSETLSGFKRYVDGPALNRGWVMAMVMRYLGQPHDELLNLSQSLRGLKRVSEAPENEITQVDGLAPVDRALTLAVHNCGACHYNRDNEPASYLGNPLQPATLAERCSRLSQCSPRMLYRLKMWECSTADWAVKKSPMPPEYRFKSIGVDEEFWKSHDRVQLFQALQTVFPKMELPALLQAKGLTPGDALKVTQELQVTGCEPRLAEIFERLPDCHASMASTPAICQ